MLKSLTLENFKSWQKIDKMHFASITGLFGTNSSGKTSILQMLLLLKQTVESPDQKQVLNFGDEKTYANLGTFKDMIYDHNIENALSWKISLMLTEQQQKDIRITTKEILQPTNDSEISNLATIKTI